jgi:hypothetical protein
MSGVESDGACRHPSHSGGISPLVFSGEAEDLESLLSGGAHRPQYVRRATGNRDQHIAGAAETEDLPLEYWS